MLWASVCANCVREGRKRVVESLLLPGLALFCVLSGLRARIGVYDAFVHGAKEGLKTLLEMLPYLCAILTATALLRSSGALSALERLLAPVMRILNVPGEAMSVVLLRPFSGSASLAAVSDVMALTGADSRAAQIACVVSAASETVFFTGSVYLGAAGVRSARYAVAAALLAYLAAVISASVMIA